MLLVELEQTLLGLGVVLVLLLRLGLGAEVVKLLLLALVVILDQRDDIDEVRVVGVDVPHLNLNQVLYHLFSFVEGLQQ